MVPSKEIARSGGPLNPVIPAAGRGYRQRMNPRLSRDDGETPVFFSADEQPAAEREFAKSYLVSVGPRFLVLL